MQDTGAKKLRSPKQSEPRSGTNQFILKVEIVRFREIAKTGVIVGGGFFSRCGFFNRGGNNGSRSLGGIDGGVGHFKEVSDFNGFGYALFRIHVSNCRAVGNGVH